MRLSDDVSEKLVNVFSVSAARNCVEPLNESCGEIPAHGSVDSPSTSSSTLVRQTNAVISPRAAQKRVPEAATGLVEVVNPLLVVPSEEDLCEVPLLVSLDFCCSCYFRSSDEVHRLEFHLVPLVVRAQSAYAEVYVVPPKQVDNSLAERHVRLAL